MSRMSVNVEVNGLIVSAYLTDEGMVVDVFGMVDEESEIIASGWETFNEVGLEPPQRIKEFL